MLAKDRQISDALPQLTHCDVKLPSLDSELSPSDPCHSKRSPSAVLCGFCEETEEGGVSLFGRSSIGDNRRFAVDDAITSKSELFHQVSVVYLRDFDGRKEISLDFLADNAR